MRHEDLTDWDWVQDHAFQVRLDTYRMVLSFGLVVSGLSAFEAHDIALPIVPSIY